MIYWQGEDILIRDMEESDVSGICRADGEESEDNICIFILKYMKKRR